jgi:uncharacterized membrane protein YraQ (UPF0718 family)
MSSQPVHIPPSPWREEGWKLAAGLTVFAVAFFLPLEWPRFMNAVHEALALTRSYAQEHVLLCLVPAFFIAGAIGAFVSQGAVMKYLGPQAPKPLAYAVASVSGTILAVCSCTILPLFAGIWRRGAGLGPATAFLYSGPAINVLAIVLTAAVLGPEMGLARAVGAVGFSVLIGLAMHWIYRKEELERARTALHLPEEDSTRPLFRTVLYFASMIGILVFANWGRPQAQEGFWFLVWSWKWILTSAFGLGFAAILVAWFDLPLRRVAGVGLATVLAWMASRFWLLPTWGDRLGFTEIPLPWDALIPFAVASVGLSFILSTGERSDELDDWFSQSWGFARQIAPLLLAGVLVAGFLLGRPEHEGLIPNAWVATLVGGNSLAANFFAAISGAFMYFATLTEVPILQGLIGSGMGKGPALALLLAGPSLSLPSMLVLRSVMGTGKTLVYAGLVVLFATMTGLVFGTLFP